MRLANHLLVLTVIFFCSCNSHSKEDKEPGKKEIVYSKKEYKAGDILPNHVIRDIENKPVDLFDSTRTNLIVFWASWCMPCRLEIATMRKFYEEVSQNNKIHLVSVSLDDTKGDWKEALKQLNMSWPQAIAEGEIDMIEPTYGFPGIPYILIADKERRFIKGVLGFDKGNEDTVKYCLSTIK